VGLIVDWLLKKLGTKEAQVTKLEIDKVPVEFEEDAIKIAVLRRIRETIN